MRPSRVWHKEGRELWVKLGHLYTEWHERIDGSWLKIRRHWHIHALVLSQPLNDCTSLDRLLSLATSKICHFLSQWFLFLCFQDWLGLINYFFRLCCKNQFNSVMRLQWLSQVVLYASFLNHCTFVLNLLVDQSVRNLPATQQMRVQSLGWEDPLDKETATHSSILA